MSSSSNKALTERTMLNCLAQAGYAMDYAKALNLLNENYFDLIDSIYEAEVGFRYESSKRQALRAVKGIHSQLLMELLTDRYLAREMANRWENS